jgi:ATP-dependent Clp protease ATP-binding subunit ClpX
MKWLAKIFGRAEGTVDLPNDTQPDATVCSFCRHSSSEVGPLVASPAGVFICDACIEHCRAVLDEEKRRQATPRMGAEPPSPHSPPGSAEGLHAADRERADRSS